MDNQLLIMDYLTASSNIYFVNKISFYQWIKILYTPFIKGCLSVSYTRESWHIQSCAFLENDR